MNPQRVLPGVIEKQREEGWPDMHPEDYCHICGNENPSWYCNRQDWLIATKHWAEETGREGICCPTCFLKMYEEATGMTLIMSIAVLQARSDA